MYIFQFGIVSGWGIGEKRQSPPISESEKWEKQTLISKNFFLTVPFSGEKVRTVFGSKFETKNDESQISLRKKLVFPPFPTVPIHLFQPSFSTQSSLP